MDKTWKLSPSELTFFWDECPRCFYLKVVNGISRPSTPMPKIFNKIDKLMKDYFHEKSTSEVCLELPEGRIMLKERLVASEAITIPGHSSSIFFKGKFDALIKFDDGSYGIIDFKTSEPKSDHVELYRRQLHAYAYALEHPKPGALSLKPVSVMGLLFVNPDEILRHESGKLGYMGDVTWKPCVRDDDWFLGFIGEVVTLLEQPYPPQGRKDCEWCEYRDRARSHGF